MAKKKPLDVCDAQLKLRASAIGGIAWGEWNDRAARAEQVLLYRG
jgi:hypothetical protein